MNAVILAGGMGERLRPISLDRPKPLLPLLGKPVLGRTLERLGQAGVRRVTLALCHRAQELEAWCADNSPPGLALRVRVEAEPLGTAGAVRALLDELGQEDVLVVPGDCYFSFDLRELFAFHQTCRSAVTLALARRGGAGECGMVVTDDAGRVERFVEKPAWDQVLSDTVNTGIYLVTRRALEKVPPGLPWDFARDLFPSLLAQGEPLFGRVLEGYWRDLGTPGAYLECVADLLAGKGGFTPDAPKVAPGVWSHVPIPEGVQVVPPCWFDRQVCLGEGALVGPHVALEQGASVGRRALVQRAALLEGARADDRATLYGAVLCRGAVAGRGSVLNEGTVLGEGARAGERAVLAEGVSVWPGREAPAGARLTIPLTTGNLRGTLRFGDGGVLRGLVDEELTPEAMVCLGVALGTEGRIALGRCGGDGAAMLARALGAGVCAGGGAVLSHDAPSPAAACWLGEYYALPLSVFVEQEGDRAYIHCFDSCGLPLESARTRRLEHRLAAGGVRVSAGQVGGWETLTGISASWAADACRRLRPARPFSAPPTIAVPGQSPWDQVLVEVLERLGCRVVRQAAPGVPAFGSGHGGFHLLAWTEDTQSVPSQRLLALLCLLELEQGEVVAVPPAAPAVLERIAKEYGAQVLRLGRDQGAAGRYQAQPWLRDALFAAGRLAVHMGCTGCSLSALLSRVPPFVLRRREIPLQRGRGELMEEFMSSFRRSEPAGAGVRLSAGAGWVYVAPLVRRPAVQVLAEGENAEIAEELCVFYENEVRRLDGQLGG